MDSFGVINNSSIQYPRMKNTIYLLTSTPLAGHLLFVFFFGSFLVIVGWSHIKIDIIESHMINKDSQGSKLGTNTKGKQGHNNRRGRSTQNQFQDHAACMHKVQQSFLHPMLQVVRMVMMGSLPVSSGHRQAQLWC